MLQAARLQQAKKEAARGWRATLSGGKDKLWSEQDQAPSQRDDGEEDQSEKEVVEAPPQPSVQETAQKDRSVAVTGCLLIYMCSLLSHVTSM